MHASASPPSADHRGVRVQASFGGERGRRASQVTRGGRPRKPHFSRWLLLTSDVGSTRALPRPSRLTAEVIRASRHILLRRGEAEALGGTRAPGCYRTALLVARRETPDLGDDTGRGGGHGIASGGRMDLDVVRNQGQAEDGAGTSRHRGQHRPECPRTTTHARPSCPRSLQGLRRTLSPGQATWATWKHGGFGRFTLESGAGRRKPPSHRGSAWDDSPRGNSRTVTACPVQRALRNTDSVGTGSASLPFTRVPR